MPSANIAVNQRTPPLAQHPTITEKGARGFLLWMKSDPVMSKVYNAARGQLQTRAGMYATDPSAGGFSGMGAFLPSGATLLPATGAGMGGMHYGSGGMRGFGYLGQDTSDSLQVVTMPSDLSSYSDPVIQTAPTDASSSNSFLSNISSIVGAVGQAALTADQIATANKVTNLQLQQAAAGKPPLNLSSYGLSTTPGFNLGLSSSTETTLLIAAGILGAVLLLPKMLKR